MIQIDWDLKSFDFKDIGDQVVEQFKSANTYAHHLLESIIKQCIKERSLAPKNPDFYVGYFIDHTHHLIKKSITNPYFWGYEVKSITYFSNGLDLLFNGLFNSSEKRGEK